MIATATFNLPSLLSGSLNSEAFKEYIEQHLASTLHKSEIVVIDNLHCHKINGSGQSAERAGARVCDLPPYSPNLNPIEMIWLKIKAILRSTKARTVHTLLDAPSVAFHIILISDIIE